MCDDNDMEGARLWFYGGTPPLDDLQLEEQDPPAPSKAGWGWWDSRAAAPSAGRGAAADHPSQLKAA